MAYKDLSIRERAAVIKTAVSNGITTLPEIKEAYNKFDEGGLEQPTLEDVRQIINTSDKDFAKRIIEGPTRQSIPAWEDSTKVATHKLGWTTEGDKAVVYPNVQNINGRLVDFTRPPYNQWAGYDNAVQRGDTIQTTPVMADYLTTHYKEAYPFKNGGHLFEEGGLKEKYIKSLDAWIQQNPTIKLKNGKTLNTKDFRDYLIELVGLESSYRPNVSQGSYNGWYQLHNSEFNPKDQHGAAFKHLVGILSNNITSKDIEKANELGINQASLLTKYWNQGNRVTNYLHNGIDDEDGLNTKISTYGNNIGDIIDYSKFVPEAIETPYITATNGKSLSDLITRARNPYINYSNREKSILWLNEAHTPNFNSSNYRIGDTLWVAPPQSDYLVYPYDINTNTFNNTENEKKIKIGNFVEEAKNNLLPNIMKLVIKGEPLTVTNNTNIQHSTGGPMYPFSFSKQGIPQVRY